MTTVVNNPTPSENSGGSGFLIGIIFLIAFISVLLYFGIPAMRNMGPIQVNVPTPEVIVPNKVDVTVTPAE